MMRNTLPRFIIVLATVALAWEEVPVLTMDQLSGSGDPSRSTSASTEEPDVDEFEVLVGGGKKTLFLPRKPPPHLQPLSAELRASDKHDEVGHAFCTSSSSSSSSLSTEQKCAVCESVARFWVKSDAIAWARRNATLDSRINVVGLVDCEQMLQRGDKLGVPSITLGRVSVPDAMRACAALRDEASRQISAAGVDAWVDDVADPVSRRWEASGTDIDDPFRCFHDRGEDIAARMCAQMSCCPADRLVGCPRLSASCSLCSDTAKAMAAQVLRPRGGNANSAPSAAASAAASSARAHRLSPTWTRSYDQDLSSQLTEWQRGLEAPLTAELAGLRTRLDAISSRVATYLDQSRLLSRLLRHGRRGLAAKKDLEARMRLVPSCLRVRTALNSAVFNLARSLAADTTDTDIDTADTGSGASGGKGGGKNKGSDEDSRAEDRRCFPPKDVGKWWKRVKHGITGQRRSCLEVLRRRSARSASTTTTMTKTTTPATTTASPATAVVAGAAAAAAAAAALPVATVVPSHQREKLRLAAREVCERVWPELASRLFDVVADDDSHGTPKARPPSPQPRQELNGLPSLEGFVLMDCMAIVTGWDEGESGKTACAVQEEQKLDRVALAEADAFKAYAEHAKKAPEILLARRGGGSNVALDSDLDRIAAAVATGTGSASGSGSRRRRSAPPNPQATVPQPATLSHIEKAQAALSAELGDAIFDEEDALKARLRKALRTRNALIYARANTDLLGRGVNRALRVRYGAALGQSINVQASAIAAYNRRSDRDGADSEKSRQRRADHERHRLGPLDRVEAPPLPTPPLSLGAEGWVNFISAALPNFVAATAKKRCTMEHHGEGGPSKGGRGGLLGGWALPSCWEVLRTLAGDGTGLEAAGEIGGSSASVAHGIGRACSAWLPICRDKTWLPGSNKALQHFGDEA